MEVQVSSFMTLPIQQIKHRITASKATARQLVENETEASCIVNHVNQPAIDLSAPKYEPKLPCANGAWPIWSVTVHFVNICVKNEQIQ
jgi:hypothetical protein